MINPPLVLYEPESAHDAIRGYLLSRQEGDDDGAFYCVQLTEPRTQAGRSIEVGKLLALPEAPSIRALSYLMPKLEPVAPSGDLLPKSVYEVIVDPLRRSGESWLFLLHARPLLAQSASPPVLRPPPFAILEPPAESPADPAASPAQS